MTEILIYGAYGFTGELVVREAIRRGLRPVIAGRDAVRLRLLADELSLEWRVFPATEATAELNGVHVLLNCAGPFSTTALPLVEACIRAKIHYVDITGEIPVFVACHGRDAKAREAGIVLLPGAGFDVVPTDCLAAMLKQQMPEAVTINLAFSFGTKPSIGTVRTSLEGAAKGGLIRRDQELKVEAIARCIRKIPFPGGQQWAASFPWGDVFTSGISTGVPNGTVYAAMPLAVALGMRLSSPFRGTLKYSYVQRGLDRLATLFFSGGPVEAARNEQRSSFWGEAVDCDGRRVALGFSAPNVYTLTADTAVEIAHRCISWNGGGGYYTPSMLLGADFVTTRPGFSFVTDS